MILIPNLAKTANSVSAHFAYIVTPLFVEDPDDVFPFFVKNTTIQASVYHPPFSVLACSLASEWTLNASLSIGSATITATDEILSYSPETNIGDKTGANAMSQISWSDSADSDEDDYYISANFSVGRIPPSYQREPGLWTLPFGVLISANDNTDEEEPTSRTLWGGNFETTQEISDEDEYTGITITVAGQSVKIYTVGGGAATPSGTITLVPTAWLPYFSASPQSA